METFGIYFSDRGWLDEEKHDGTHKRGNFAIVLEGHSVKFLTKLPKLFII